MSLTDTAKYGEMILSVYEQYRQKEDITLARFRLGLAATHKVGDRNLEKGTFQKTGDTKRVAELLDGPTLLCFETAYGRDSGVYRDCQPLMILP